MKHLLAILALIIALTGCAGKTGPGLITPDGKLDETEKAIVGITVDAALAAKPSAVAPAYAVSTALLSSRDVLLGQSIPVQYLEQVIDAEVAKLGLTPTGVQDFKFLVTIVKSKIQLDLDVQGIDPQARFVFVFDVVKVVDDVAGARMR